MLKAVALVVLSLALEGAFVLHAVTQAPAPRRAPTSISSGALAQAR